MLLLVFSVLGLATMMVAYSLGVGGTVGVIIFLAFLFTGATLRYLEPLIQRLRP